MTVVVIGGHDRYKSKLEQFAREIKINLKFIGRRGPNTSEILSKADLVLVITGCISHDLANLAKKCAKEKCVFCQAKGLCNIKETICHYRDLT